MLTWKRGRKAETDCSTWTVWQAQDAPYRVVRVASHYGLPLRFVAMEGPLRIISEHKTRNAAEQACQREAAQPRKGKS